MALINLRNALMTGRRLPYDAEIEYIESTGTQWINTGVICDQGTDIIFSGRTRTVTTATMFFFGARTAFTQNAFTACLTWNVGQNQMLTQVGFGSFNGQNYLPSIPSNSDFVISNSGTTWSLTVGGQTTQITAATSAFTTPTTALLFRMSNNGTPDSRSFNGAIYSVKLYQNGVLVRDFIPVRKGTVGYLYDRVSGKLFGNAGTGDFVLGQDVVPVEYIESHGTEWIDTGVVPTDTTGVLIDCTVPTNNSRDNIVVGTRQDSGNTRYWIDFDWSNYDTFYFGFSIITPRADNSLRQYEGERVQAGMNYQNGRICTVNGKKFSNLPISSSLPTITKSIYCFRGNYPTPYAYSGKIFSLQITDGLTFVRDYKAIRVGTEGAMMDTLTRRIYRNQGTGAFTFGNDLKYPIPAE